MDISNTTQSSIIARTRTRKRKCDVYDGSSDKETHKGSYCFPSTVDSGFLRSKLHCFYAKEGGFCLRDERKLIRRVSMTPRTSTPSDNENKFLHIAPMLHVSTPEFHQFFRILSKRCVLWTEMVVDETLVYTDNVDEHLGYDSRMHPIMCQIGGWNPEYAAKATKLVQEYGYDEINLNVDCPSDRVSGKRLFGAALMKQQQTCIDMVKAMHDNATSIPISIKCRIGIDHLQDEIFLVDFIESLTPYCQTFYIHARSCWLNGISPAQNRIIPPLNYPRVYALCRKFPNCQFILNGGIAGLQQARRLVLCNHENVKEHTGAPCALCDLSNGSCVAPPSPTAPPNLKGCMLGRAAMENPSLFWDVDRYFYKKATNPCHNRRQVLEQYCNYLEETYPRRCCDADQRKTTKIPAPNVVHTLEYCPICQEGGENCTGNGATITREPTRRVIMISSRVIDRSLKPVLGIFFGLPRAKVFRRTCDELSRDCVIRNCGPAFILRTAIKVVSNEALDQDFVKTEDLSEHDIVSHLAPRTNAACC